jgi:hypothetical protein
VDAGAVDEATKLVAKDFTRRPARGSVKMFVGDNVAEIGLGRKIFWQLAVRYFATTLSGRTRTFGLATQTPQYLTRALPLTLVTPSLASP